MVTILRPSGVRPAPDFELQADESYQRLQGALDERTHIEATFQRRSD